MPQVLALKPNDKPETIFSPRDFEELIDKHMGFDDDKDISEEIEEVLKVNGY